MKIRQNVTSRNWISPTTKLWLAFSLLVTSLCLPAHAQVRNTYNEGAVGLGFLLRRLQTTASVLHTGAHPDDEDSALIARLARGDGARVAYLSLNRGEGGQNRIGAELFDPLGVIRTEELLQARRLDGGEQFFARSFDFGFTKTREEAARRWNERELLEDMVRVIRKFRPLVVISRWEGTPADGHGQHQFAGYLTPIAFRAAADPAEFPEQLAEGLRPWQAKKLYVSHFATPPVEGATATTQPIVEIDTGRFDALLGRSYYELAMEGRSQHKSQGETALELRGAQTSRVRLVEKAPSPFQTAAREQTIYDGLDTSIRGILRTAGMRDSSLIKDLELIEEDAARALKSFNALDPRTVVASLTGALANTIQARQKFARIKDSPDALAEADFLLAQKEREFKEALRLASGVRIDALADAETVARGESFVVAVRAFMPEQPLAGVEDLHLRAPEGWRVERIDQPSKSEAAFVARESAQAVAYFRVRVPGDAELTQPYWLYQWGRPPRKGDMYVWYRETPMRKPYPVNRAGEPFAPPLLVGEAVLRAGGTPQLISQPVEYRYLDSVRGEVRREVNVVPELSVELDPALVIVPTGSRNRTREVTVQLVNNVGGSTDNAVGAIATGAASVRVPAGWKRQPEASGFTFKTKGERVTLKFTLTIPRSVRPGAYHIDATATADYAGRLKPSLWFGQSQRALSYPHIQTHYYYPDAEASVRVFDLQVASVRVGYIMGSGDEVPEAIRRMGLDVTLLDEAQLAAGDLSRFDTIVVGVRASQTRPDFVANHARLMEFVQRGGALIVQYQRPDYAAKKLPPYPAAMEVAPTRAGESPTIARVVDENASVNVLQPAHPAFNFPNKITAADWQGWVQERNLYNFTTFDARYTPLLESHDAGEAAQSGGEVYARIGRGHYVYTSYAWFRQLPAGVPGAYRLFANLLSLPKASPQRARR